MSRSHLLTKISLLTIIGLFLVQIFVSNQLATSGVQINRIQEQISLLTKENQLLKEQIDQKTSLSFISSQAAQLGFDQTPSTIALHNPSPLALNQ